MKSFIVLFWVVSVCKVVYSQFNGDKSIIFSRVFGMNTANAHFTDESAIDGIIIEHNDNEIKAAIESTDDLSSLELSTNPVSILACSNFANGPAMSQNLKEIFSENAYPMYVDDPSDMSCFRIIPKDSDELTTIQSNIDSWEYLIFWTIVPDVIKLDPSLIGYQEGVSQGVQDIPLNDDHENAVDIYIIYGLGIYDFGLYGLTMTTAASRLTQMLVSPEMCSSLLSRMISLSDPQSESGLMWRSASEKLTGIQSSNQPDLTIPALCGFEGLDVTEKGKKSVKISNLESIRTAAVDEDDVMGACLAVLYAVAIQQPRSLYAYLSARPRILNYNAKQCVQTGSSSGGTPYHTAGLDGTGQVIGLFDTGLDLYSCYFAEPDNSIVAISTIQSPTFDSTKTKVIQYVYWPTYTDTSDYNNGHGTHVAGTLAGNPVNNNTVKIDEFGGQAYGAKIAFFDGTIGASSSLATPPLADYLFAIAYTAGAKVYSNSWGTSSTTGDVDNDAVETDSYMYNTTDFLAIFAAGNDGSNGLKTISNPALSKNVLTIGASVTLAPTTVAYFSSRGPTADGRYGVDVLAPGYSINSAAANGVGSTTRTCRFYSNQGTSMSTPAASGAAAMVRQYFQSGTYWAAECRNTYSLCNTFSPRGSTVKAVLIHSTYYATTLQATPPSNSPTALPTPAGGGADNYQGYGGIDLKNVLKVTGVTTSGFDLFVDEVSLTAGQSVSYSVTVSSNTISLRATICWTDPPAMVGSGKQLLNDIDLTVTDVGTSTVYKGNGGGTKDSVNNVERVIISSPTVASPAYTVTVSAASITRMVKGHQTVSVVITSYGLVGTSPTSVPTTSPTLNPSVTPTIKPSTSPTINPSVKPSVQPTVIPSISPTVSPSVKPTVLPTSTPVAAPSVNPTTKPTVLPSTMPSVIPTTTPTVSPNSNPTVVPTLVPTRPTNKPTVLPTSTPSESPSAAPTVPTSSPSAVPSRSPSSTPSTTPTTIPSVLPSVTPTVLPTARPTGVPVEAPSLTPTLSPSSQPTVHPTIAPSRTPSAAPTAAPSVTPSSSPSSLPSLVPISHPTATPSDSPSVKPSNLPIAHPTYQPTAEPTPKPTTRPSPAPTATPISTLDTVMCDLLNGLQVTSGVTASFNWKCDGLLPTPLVCVGSQSGWTGVTCDSNGDVTAIAITAASGVILSGTIASELGWLSSLQSLAISGTGLKGVIPSSLGDLFSLTALRLPSNSLSGTVPSALSQLTNLKALDLDTNKLTGTLPSFVSSLTKLGSLDLSDNLFSGSISSSIGSLTSLTSLSLANNNKLAGTIPTAIGQLLSLTSLELSGTGLTGTLPATFSILVKLVTLDVGNTALTGSVPSALCAISGLSTLDISNTNFNAYASCLSTVAVLVLLHPTTIPTSPPVTHRPSVLPSPAPTVMPSAQPCLKLQLFDTFGDGWNTAALHVVDSRTGSVKTYAPTATTNFATTTRYCVAVSGTSLGDTFSLGVAGVGVEQDWELFWTAQDARSGFQYRGIYSTTMEFVITQSEPGQYTFSLKSSRGLVMSTSCSDCLVYNMKGRRLHASASHGAKNNNNNNKGSPGGGNSKSNPGAGAGNGKGVTAATPAIVLDSEPSKAAVVSSDAAAMTEKREITYSLFGAGNVWSSLNGYGTTFDISSTDGRTRYFSGAMCGSLASDRHCRLSSLPVGSYIWRVSGAHDKNQNDIAWEFCGVRGGPMTELLFQIDGDGDCVSLATNVYELPNSLQNDPRYQFLSGYELGAVSADTTTTGSSQHNFESTYSHPQTSDSWSLGATNAASGVAVGEGFGLEVQLSGIRTSMFTNDVLSLVEEVVVQLLTNGIDAARVSSQSDHLLATGVDAAAMGQQGMTSNVAVLQRREQKEVYGASSPPNLHTVTLEVSLSLPSEFLTSKYGGGREGGGEQASLVALSQDLQEYLATCFEDSLFTALLAGRARARGVQLGDTEFVEQEFSELKFNVGSSGSSYQQSETRPTTATSLGQSMGLFSTFFGSTFVYVGVVIIALGTVAATAYSRHKRRQLLDRRLSEFLDPHSGLESLLSAGNNRRDVVSASPHAQDSIADAVSFGKNIHVVLGRDSSPGTDRRV